VKKNLFRLFHFFTFSPLYFRNASPKKHNLLSRSRYLSDRGGGRAQCRLDFAESAAGRAAGFRHRFFRFNHYRIDFKYDF
jgi:hypothetical protein